MTASDCMQKGTGVSPTCILAAHEQRGRSKHGPSGFEGRGGKQGTEKLIRWNVQSEMVQRSEMVVAAWPDTD